MTTTVTGSSTTLTSATAFFSAWISVRRGVGKGLGVGLDLLDHQAAQRGRVAQDVFELALLVAQLFQLLLDLDGLQPRQLAQADFKNVFGLPVATA